MRTEVERSQSTRRREARPLSNPDSSRLGSSSAACDPAAPIALRQFINLNNLEESTPMDLRALINRDNFNRSSDQFLRSRGDVAGQPRASQLDPADLLEAFARIHALGLAHLASGGQADGRMPDQRWPGPREAREAPPRGLLPLLLAASASTAPPLLANAAATTPGTTGLDTTGASQVEDRTRRRYVSGIADQVNGGAANPKPQLLARGITNCDNAFSYCMARLPDLRSRGKCDRLRDLCVRGIDGIFGPGVAGSSKVE